MAPEYGATMGFFPRSTAECVNYLRATGRTDEARQGTYEKLLQGRKACGAFRRRATITYSQEELETRISVRVLPSVAGPETSAGPHRNWPKAEKMNFWTGVQQGPSPKMAFWHEGRGDDPPRWHVSAAGENFIPVGGKPGER